MKIKKSVILTSTLIFALGIISVGYGYWTDRLEFEGSADVRMELNVIDDIVDETPSPTAIELTDEVINTGESDNASLDDPMMEVEKPEDQQGTVDDNGIDTDIDNSEETNLNSDNGDTNEGSDNSQTESTQPTSQDSNAANSVDQETTNVIDPLSESEEPAAEGS